VRNAFIRALEEVDREDRSLFVLTADLGYTVFERFSRDFPGRFINAGIAEAGMMSLAAGLAHSGKRVVAYSIGTFSTMRCFEQIRNDIGLHRSRVMIVGAGGGFAYGVGGATHHPVEDIGLMRLVPGMTIVCPSGPRDTAAATISCLKLDGPSYLRINRVGEPDLPERLGGFKLGRGIVHREGSDLTIIGSGAVMANVMEAAELLSGNGLEARVLEIHTVQPLDIGLIMESAAKTPFLYTVEEHLTVCGLGSAVAEVLAETRGNRIPMLRIGITDFAGAPVGSQQHLRSYFGLDPQGLVRTILKHALSDIS